MIVSDAHVLGHRARKFRRANVFSGLGCRLGFRWWRGSSLLRWRRRWFSIWTQHFLNRFTQLAFRIEHELPGRDDALAFLQSANDLNLIVLAARAEIDRARFEFSILQGNEDRVLVAAAQNRGVRYEQRLGLQLGAELNRSEHSRFQEESGIVKLHPHFCRPRFLVDRWIDVSDPALKLPVRQIRQTDFGFLSDLQQGQILLVNLRLHPND